MFEKVRIREASFAMFAWIVIYSTADRPLSLLRHYADTHHLDVRSSTRAVSLSLAAGGTATQPKWVIHTVDGIFLADNIVLTGCAQNQLRRILLSLGIQIGRDVLSAMRALGLYWVGVGDLIAPTTREILRQAKLVSQTISARSSAAALRSLA